MIILAKTFSVLFQLLILPLEMMVRFDMGERYISGIKIIVSWILFIGASVFIVFAFDGDEGLPVLIGIDLLPLIFIYHRKKDVRNSYKDNQMMHSYYSGYPKFALIDQDRFNINESTAKKYWEPLFFLVLGGVLFIPPFAFVSNDTFRHYAGGILVFYAFYFSIGGLVLFLKAQIEHFIARDRYLDAQDEYIESKQMQTALHPVSQEKDVLSFKQKKEDAFYTQGFSIPGRVPSDPKVRDSIGKMYERLSPRYKNIMMAKKPQSRQAQPNRNQSSPSREIAKGK